MPATETSGSHCPPRTEHPKLADPRVQPPKQHPSDAPPPRQDLPSRPPTIYSAPLHRDRRLSSCLRFDESFDRGRGRDRAGHETFPLLSRSHLRFTNDQATRFSRRVRNSRGTKVRRRSRRPPPAEGLITGLPTRRFGPPQGAGEIIVFRPHMPWKEIRAAPAYPSELV